jgi:hypothetical protein
MLQAQELVSLACQICQCPGRTVQAGQMLNLILANYALRLDLDTVRLTTTLNISAQAVTPYFYPLPARYLRMAEKPFYNVLGTVYQVSQMPLEELDGAYTASGIDNYPEWYATDMSDTPQPTAGTSPSIAFYPPPAVPLAVTCRYRPSSLDIVAPETSATIPYYPDQLVLLKELCIMVGDVAGGEDRTLRWEREIEKRTSQYLAMDDDKEGYAQQVKLDSRYFRRNNNLPPSKLLGF